MATGSMNAQDILWLNMDRANNLMVVDSMVVLPEPADWDRVVDTIQERMIDRFPVFRRRAVMPSGPTGKPFWEDDPTFDRERHFVRVTLPGDGDDAALKEYVSAQRSVMLDKSRPLWIMHLIDNYLGGSAMMIRIHHAIADGIRLTMLTLSLCDNAEGGPLMAPKAVGRGAGGAEAPERTAPPSARQRIAGGVEQVRQLATGLVTNPAGTARSLVTGTVSTAQQALGSTVEALEQTMSSELLSPDRFQEFSDAVERNAKILPKILTAASDPGPWDGELGVDKLLTWTDAIPLSVVKAIGQATGATVNDVLVSALSLALRTYSAERGHSVGKVVWFVPVNVKPLDQNLPKELGNSFALVLLVMPTDIEDPVIALAENKAMMDEIKASYEPQLTFGVQSSLAVAPESVYSFGVEFFANRGTGVLSNVPGPREQVFLAGQEVGWVVGFAPCNGTQPMSVTIFSMNGNVRVGLSGDAGLLPDLDRLAGLYQDALQSLYDEVVQLEHDPIEVAGSVL